MSESPETPDTASDDRTLFRKFLDLPGRTKLFIFLIVLLPILAWVGPLQSDRDVEIDREEVLEIARVHVDFEPVNESVRLFRQGAAGNPVWVASFNIPIEGNSREFERITTVEVDARTGEVKRISVDNFDELDLEEVEEGDG